MKKLSNMVDVIVEPRYDTNTILAAGALALAYFVVPKGQGQSNFGAAGVAKTYADTNMEVAGMLPAGYSFRVLGFRVQPAFTLLYANATTWSVGAWFTFYVGSKPYCRVPLDTLPAGVGPNLSVVAAATGGSHGFPFLDNSYKIGKKPLDLDPMTNFSATLEWTAVVANTTTVPTQVAAGMPVRVYLDGFLYRAVQ